MQFIETNLATLATAFSQANVAVIDFETSGVRPHRMTVAGLGVYIPQLDRYWYINTGHTLADPDFPKVPVAQLANAITPFLVDPSRRVIAHNAPYELRVLIHMGVHASCRVSDSLIHTHRCDENLSDKHGVTRAYLPRVSYGLKELTEIYYNERPPTLHDVVGKRNTIFSAVRPVAGYCAYDCLNTWRLYQRAANLIQHDAALPGLTAQIDDPNNMVISKMLWEGVGVDVDEARRQSALYDVAIQMCREEIWSRLNINWSLDSPRDILRVLRHMNLSVDLGFDPFELPLEAWEHEPSIASEILVELIGQCADAGKQAILAIILWKFRMMQRKSAFLDALPPKVINGRLHCDRFSSTLVTTRFSSSPSVQNLPGRADADNTDDPEHWENLVPPACHANYQTRDIFVARPGHSLVSMDLSAAEPRYLALLFEQAIHVREINYRQRRDALDQVRWTAYPALMQEMRLTRIPRSYEPPEPLGWPDYDHDPLWEAFNAGQDPYDALLQAMCPADYANVMAQGTAPAWFAENRWRSKLAFLALGYGGTAETLAPKLNWTVPQTEAAIENLLNTYQTFTPLKKLTKLEVLHLGEVRSLWGRPRRLNGYYQLAHPAPLTVHFYRMRPTHREYEARIIPLGTTVNGVQCLVEECAVLDEEAETKEVVLACQHNSGGTYNLHADHSDTFVRADHFNTIPFRNINYSHMRWIRDEHGLQRPLEKQERATRQAFNARCQSTGADHIRWLMNRIDHEVVTPTFPDCHLVLTVHDSLVYEVPENRLLPFITAAYPIMRCRPSWSDIDFKVKVEFGVKFGDLTAWTPPTAVPPPTP